MNEKGSHYADYAIGYSKLRKISVLTGAAYDSEGKLIKKLKSTDIIDRSYFDGVSLYSDTRVKSADLSQATYPYTVQFEYEIEHKYLFGLQGATIVSEKTYLFSMHLIS